MDIESLLKDVESVLEMDEQADRSVALDKIRESITVLGGDIKDYESKVAELESDKEKLLERNKALFNRVDGRPTNPEARTSVSYSESLKNSLKTGTFFN